MRFELSQADEAFRREVREFVAAEVPPAVRRKVRLGIALERDDYAAWYQRLYRRGWATPGWSREWGGTDWTPLQRHLFDEEILLGGAPRMVASGIVMLGPVLIRFGTEEQKRRYLPEIAQTRVWWTQGFSEPGSGSDLASMRTRARRGRDGRGEHYMVNGQKIWTSFAQFSEMMFCLVRTDPAAPKPQQGISFLLIDMRTPGITVRPIRTLDGRADLNEVFFDDVRVPAENLVGHEHDGWTCAKYLLGHERGGIAGIGAAKQQLVRLRRLASIPRSGRRPLGGDPVFKAQVDRLDVRLLALEATALRLLANQPGSIAPAAQTSLLKVAGTELRQDIFRLMLDVAGPEAALWPAMAPGDGHASRPALSDEEPFAELRSLAVDYLDARKFSIYGGTNEVQRNLIAKALLAN